MQVSWRRGRNFPSTPLTHGAHYFMMKHSSCQQGTESFVSCWGADRCHRTTEAGAPRAPPLPRRTEKEQSSRLS